MGKGLKIREIPPNKPKLPNLSNNPPRLKRFLLSLRLKRRSLLSILSKRSSIRSKRSSIRSKRLLLSLRLKRSPRRSLCHLGRRVSLHQSPLRGRRSHGSKSLLSLSRHGPLLSLSLSRIRSPRRSGSRSRSRSLRLSLSRFPPRRVSPFRCEEHSCRRTKASTANTSSVYTAFMARASCEQRK